MGYWKIKKSVFAEIVISALLGMIISLIAVLYLVEKINALNQVISDLQNREPIIINTQVETEDSLIENEPLKEENNVEFSASLDDRELLARLLYCEGRGESVDCQKAIVSVVLNRLKNGYWGDTFREVIYAKGQFSPVSSGLIDKAKPSQTQYDIVDYILENGSTLPSWVLYFRASYHFSWSSYTPYCNIDNTYFGGYKK